MKRIDDGKVTINNFLAVTKNKYIRDLLEFEDWYKEQHRQRPTVFRWEDHYEVFWQRWWTWLELKYDPLEDPSE